MLTITESGCVFQQHDGSHTSLLLVQSLCDVKHAQLHELRSDDLEKTIREKSKVADSCVSFAHMHVASYRLMTYT